MLHKRLLVLVVCLTMALVVVPLRPSVAQSIVVPLKLLADLNTSTRSSNLGEAVAFKEQLYFVRYVERSGELWRSDGTPEGTAVVYQPGDLGYVSNLTVLGNTLFFVVSLERGGVDKALWRSDGTTAGTTLVYTFGEVNGPKHLRAVGGQLLFFTSNALWRSDGSEAGTQIVKILDAGIYEYQTLVSSDRLFFVPNRTSGFDGPGSQLWVSDGSEAGTLLVREFTPSEQAPTTAPLSLRLLAVHQGALFFERNQSSVQEVWRSDGTLAGTVLLGPSIIGGGLISTGAGLYFTVGEQLWRGDGTPAGSTLVLDLTTVGISALSYNYSLINVQGVFYFSAVDPDHGAELWRSDGTPAGTTLVRDILPGSSSSSLRVLAVVGNRLYFSADDGVHGSELWRSDGTAEQTALVRDLEQASASSLVLNYQGSIRGGERVFFNVYTGSEALSSRSFWLSDGTLSGTRVISESFQFYNAITINDRLVMQTEIPTRVWISDGTREGTVRLQSLTGSAFILNRAGNFVFMSEFSGSGFTIWSTDGTPQGTTRLFQANDVLRYIPTNTGLYALERGSDDSCLLRFTDGTLAGTRPPVPLPTNCNYSLQATSVNGLLYMLLRSDNSPQQSLWVSDGTSAGTGLIKELDYRDYYGLSATGTKLTFFARTYIESDRLFEFWASDGTAGGTSAIVSFPFFVEANLNYFGTTVTKRYFIVSLANGWQLWATDGTTAGTSVLLEGSFGLEDFSYPNWSEAIGDLLFFNGEDGEPWVSDGTPAGTYRLQDINPGAGRSQPFGFALAGRRLFFAADDGTHGAEPWVSEPSLRLVAPNALAAPDGQATLDLRVEELSLAAGSSVTLDVTLAEGVSYLGNEQNLTPVQEGNTLRFTWQVGAGALRLTPLTLRLALPANAPLGQAYPLGFKVSSSDPADNSADNQTTLEIRRVYQVVLPLVRS